MTNPVPQTDAVFLKHFAQLITFLVVVCILLILLGAYIYSRHPSPENPAQATLVDQRLAPVGAVYAGATGQAAIEAAAGRRALPRAWIPWSSTPPKGSPASRA